MIAFCGLDCEKCNAFIATKNNDNELRKKVAEEWTKAYNVNVTADFINCTGCKSTGIKTLYCENMCEVRKCAISKKVDTCADCSAFPCASINEIFKYSSEPKETLERLRAEKK